MSLFINIFIYAIIHISISVYSFTATPLHVLLGSPGVYAVLELDWSPTDAIPTVYSHLKWKQGDVVPEHGGDPEAGLLNTGVAVRWERSGNEGVA